MVQAATPFPLGAMVGGPNGGDPVAEAAFEAQYNSFVQTMGAAPQFMNAYVDQSQPITSWAGNASWTAWSWAQSPLARTATPVIGLPMATNADAANPDADFKAFAAGTYDSVLQGIVNAWGNQGFKTLYIRPGYEMDGTGMPWYTGTDPTTQSDFVAAFQHIANVLHGVAGVNVQVVWSPNIQSWNAGGAVTALYPGDHYVDVVGPDLYSPQYPRDLYDWSLNNGTYDASFAQWSSIAANRMHYWSLPAANQWTSNDGQGNSLSLQQVIDFAAAHNKPIAISETGAGAGGSGTQGPSDDPAFPQWLASTLAASGAKVDFVNIWDLNPGDGDWTFSGAGAAKPQEAAAWAKYFGALSPTAPVVTAPVVTAPVVTAPVVTTPVVTAPVVTPPVVTAPVVTAPVVTTPVVTAPIVTAPVTTAPVTTAPVVTAPVVTTPVVTAPVTAPVVTAPVVTTPVVTAPATPAVTTLGSGAAGLVLDVSEDAWQGDAQFTVSVDGTQLGGVQTATASHAAGATQAFALLGFASGAHTVAVSFLNDAWGGSASTDRNLYVDRVIEGAATTTGDALYSNATHSYAVGTPVAAPVTTAPVVTAPVTTAPVVTAPVVTAPVVTAPVTTAPVIKLGSGAAGLVLDVSEDAWQGDAQFTVSVDGTQLGGVQTATASHAVGATQAFALLGYASGAHTVAVSFLNDAWGGSASTDRNLYVDRVIEGAATTTGDALYSNATHNYVVGTPASVAAPVITTPPVTTPPVTAPVVTAPVVTAPVVTAPVVTVPATPAVTTLGSGAAGLVLDVSEDAWQGDAQFTVSVDGTQLGGVQTATALHAAGATQAFALLGYASGAHTVAVSFLNDAWGGSASTDRNLYVDRVIEGAATTTGDELYNNGTHSYAVGTAVAPITPATLANAAVSFAKPTIAAAASAGAPSVADMISAALASPTGGSAGNITARPGGAAPPPSLPATGALPAATGGDISQLLPVIAHPTS